MFENGQRVMLKTYEELAEQFGVGGEDDLYDIMTDPPIPVEMDIYLGTEVTIREKSENYDAYLIEEDEEGWAFPSVAFVNEE